MFREKITTTLSRFMAVAVTALLLTSAACGSDGASFKPGRYVAGAMIGENMGSSSSPEFAFLDYGLLDITVADDGTITGTYQILNDFFLLPTGLPDYSDVQEFAVTGTAQGTTFTMEIDADEINTVFSGEGEITPEGEIGAVLLGDCSGECPPDGYLVTIAGIEVGSTDTSIACGGMGFETDDTNGSAPGMYLVNEGTLYAAFVGPTFAGSMVTPISFDEDDLSCMMMSIEGCAEGTGTIELEGETADGPLSESLDVEFVSGVYEPGSHTYFFIDGGNETPSYGVGFGGDTDTCFDDD